MIKKQNKRFLSALVSVIMLISLLPSFVFAADGTPKINAENGAYIIEDVKDLVWFGEQVASGKNKINAELADDIDLSGTKWTAINPSDGYATSAFGGTFDGKNHLIKGLEINATAANQGLFGVVYGGTVKNLRVEGNVASSGNYVGGIVANLNGGTIENCSFSGSVSTTKKSGYAGGIAGYAKPSKSASISGCVNTASITATNSGYAGGIISWATKTNISNCYNTGKINGAFRSGTIAGQLSSKSTIDNSYSVDNIAEICGFVPPSGVAITNCFKDGSEVGADELLSQLGSAFVKDENNINGGYPILAWQSGSAPQPKDPELKISGVGELSLTNSGEQVFTTLTAEYLNTDDTVPVEWSVESGSDKVRLEKPQNPQANNSTVSVFAEKPGSAVIAAKAGNLNATFKITVYPYITTVELDKTPVEGETVSVKVFVLGGDEYNYSEYPELKISWKYSLDTGNSYTYIPGANKRELLITNDLIGKYLSVDVECVNDRRTLSRNMQVLSADEGKLEEDKSELKLDTAEIKEATALNLPKNGKNGSEITWESDNESIINPQSGAVTLPENGIVTVTLRATLTRDGKTVSKPFEIKVYSQAAVEEEKENKLLKIENVLKELGDFYKLYPVYGEDTNVLAMFEKDVKAKTSEDIKVSIAKTEEINDGANIAENGDITYFFKDPNTAPALHSALYNVTFKLALDGAEKELEVPVIIGWDADKVKALMNSEILSGVEIENTDVTEDIELPKVVNDKKWTLISWTSSDENAVSISNKNQQTADTLFNPYVGVVKRGTEDKKVTLTALFTFGFTDSVTGNDKEIVLTKVFNVTVKALEKEAVEEIRNGLLQKLNNGFEKAGLTDAVTGKALEEKDGVYIAQNDIKYPTTRDFDVDGKYYPITITSSNDDVIVPPDVNNAARTAVIRPMTGAEDENVTVTVTITDKDTAIFASKSFDITVKPLTEEEINAEKELMNRICETYFDGIKGYNREANNINASLNPFVEAYDSNGKIEWVYSEAKRTGHGIVPTALDGWEKLEAWRLFRSSNPAVIAHETLNLSKKNNAKAVTVDSALSSETLGIYGKLYKEDPIKYAAYKPLEDLYYREVSVNLTVRGYTTKSNVKPMAVEEKISASFELDGIDKMTIEKTDYRDLPETATAFDVFEKALNENGYTYKAKGSYVQSITDKAGNTLAELDEGPNSGWMFKVNGKFPDKSMSAYGLSDGDCVTIYYTKDYTKEDFGMSYDTDDDIINNINSNNDGKKDDTNKTEPDNNDDKKDDGGETPAAQFDDIKGHWAEKFVESMIEKGLMNGVSENEFAPDTKLTRAMFVTILYRMENSPKTSASLFEDVENGAWYADAAAWANENGIVNGISETEFAPDLNITREQMAAILYRYAKLKGIDGNSGESIDIHSFADFSDISEFAYEAIKYVVENKIMSGRTEDTINPKDTATRAEAAAVLSRINSAFVTE